MIETKISPTVGLASRTPLNVLHVGAGFGQRGGVASVLSEIAASKKFFEIEDIALSFFETRGFKKPINVLLFGLVDIPRFAIAMNRNVEIVHFHVSAKGSFYRKFALYVLARLWGKKTLFHWHSNDLAGFQSSAGSATARAISHFIRNADAVIGVSEEMSQDLLRERGSRDGVYTIGNSAYAAEKAAGNGEQETLGDRGVLPYLAFAGRFVPEKGIADLFAAVALLKNEGCFLRLKLAGTGDIPAWELRAKDLGIDDCVTFVGWLRGEEKLQFYRNASAFCLPSYRESFGIVTLEAMFCGIAVIGTKTAGFLALVEEGVTGYLVAPRDPEALAARIRTLIDNPERSRKMGFAGLARARRLFSIEAVTSQYVQCYRDIVVKRKGIR